jgi:(S)-3,5-dihydroxyphenylglycine transaminase
VERAEDAGVEALVLTAEPPGPRAGPRPAGGAAPANLDGALDGDDVESGWPGVEWLRSVTSLPVLLKGVRTRAEAVRAIDAGMDGLVVPAALDVLPEIASAVPCPVIVDGGIRRGGDVLASLALGAAAVFLGRPVLHGLSVGHVDGVSRVLDIVVAEFIAAMAYTGSRSVACLASDAVRLTEPAADAEPATGAGPAGDLPLAELHPSVSDPVLDTMNFLNEITARFPDAVSFAPGRPYDGFFDTEQIFDHIRRYLAHLEEQGRSPAEIRDAMFQYGPTAGRIRELIADSLRVDEGIDVPAESIVVTVGCQEAMFLAVRALHPGPDDVLLVASPCYVGITGAARVLGVPVSTVRERSDGLHCADVEAAVLAEKARGRRVRAFYTIPDHANPSGNTLPPHTRHELLELARRYDLLILEDSPYRLVSPGARVPTLKALDTARRVVHLGSYSKTVFPGARVGFAVADQSVAGGGLLAAQLTKIQSMVSVNTPVLSQAAVAGALLATGGKISELNVETADFYQHALRSTLDELERHLPAARRERLGVRWNRPAGGFFLTLTVPFTADNAALNRSAADFGVIWTPMSYFYPEGGGDRAIRLSISYLSQADIEDGTARLARFIESEAAHIQHETARKDGRP